MDNIPGDNFESDMTTRSTNNSTTPIASTSLINAAETASVRNKMRKALNTGTITNNDDDYESSADSTSTINSMLSRTAGISADRKTELAKTVQEGSGKTKKSNASSVSAKVASTIAKANGEDSTELTAQQLADAYKAFADAAKLWIKADKEIQELNKKKADLIAAIKEQEEIKDKHDEVMKNYLELSGKEEYPIKDGSKIVMLQKKKTESFSATTIPKYIEELLEAIYNEDLDFIEQQLIPLNNAKETKKYSDINWDKVPNDPVKYLEKFNSDSKFSSIILSLFASKSRSVEEVSAIKRTISKGDGGDTKRGRPTKK